MPSPPRFKVVVPGRLDRHKGLELFQQIREPLTAFAEVLLVGCGIEAEVLRGPGVNVILEYAWHDLPRILEGFQPDVGLLLSVVPETFSYTLQELMEMGIPPVATRIGSFEDRIRTGINGFLCEPTPAAVLACLRDLAHNRSALSKVHEHLGHSRFRTVAEMLQDYDAMLGIHGPSAAAYFCNDVRNRGFEHMSQSQSVGSPLIDRLIALAEVDIEQLHQDITERDQTIAHTRQRLSSIETSRSWKLTSPVRKAAEFFRKAISLPGRNVRRQD
jgi:hypothetical protein